MRKLKGDTEDTRKTQIKLLKMRYMLSKMKTTLDGLTTVETLQKKTLVNLKTQPYK